MKIRRFVAKDMKTALAQIKEELGVDAVIMSNKKIPEGVEIMAAVDHSQATPVVQTKAEPRLKADVVNLQSNHMAHTLATNKNKITAQAGSTISQQIQANDDAPSDSLAALLNRQIQRDAELKTKPLNEYQSTLASQESPEAAQHDDIEEQFRNFTNRLKQTSTEQLTEPASYAPASLSQAATSRSPAKPAVDQVEFETMKKEMQSIRQLLEHQVSGLLWQDMAQKEPSRALLINRLMGLGLTEQIADQISGYITPMQNEEDTWQQAKAFITQQINTTNNDIIQRGGVVALVGPTGVGKTTTIAKLAARFAQLHGADQVALISTDSFRIAGFEQLSTYGKIIGCQVKLANDAQELDAHLQLFAKKKLILIDTAGMGQRDMRLAQHLTTLISNARVRIRNYLVLSANTQQRVMQENVERFKKIPLAGCIYTKLDESLSIGEILSTSIQNGLSIGYLTDGQRVPEDIKVANAEKLVTLADRMAMKTSSINNASWRLQPTASTAVM